MKCAMPIKCVSPTRDDHACILVEVLEEHGSQVVVAVMSFPVMHYIVDSRAIIEFDWGHNEFFFPSIEEAQKLYKEQPAVVEAAEQYCASQYAIR